MPTRPEAGGRTVESFEHHRQPATVADQDLLERIRYYRDAASDSVAQRFFDAAMQSLRSIERSPGRGSLEIGQRCDIAGLRSMPIKGFPVRVYYFASVERLIVVRVLADAHDLLTILANSPGSD